jgi:hypothetical protein
MRARESPHDSFQLPSVLLLLIYASPVAFSSGGPGGAPLGQEEERETIKTLSGQERGEVGRIALIRGLAIRRLGQNEFTGGLAGC